MTIHAEHRSQDERSRKPQSVGAAVRFFIAGVGLAALAIPGFSHEQSWTFAGLGDNVILGAGQVALGLVWIIVGIRILVRMRRARTRTETARDPASAGSWRPPSAPAPRAQ